MTDRASTEKREKRVPTRTCVGCGVRDAAVEMAHVVVVDGTVAVDSMFSAGGGLRAEAHHGRGAHLHPRPDCIERAPRGLSRSLRGTAPASALAVQTVTATEVAQALVCACDRRMLGLLVSARRRRDVAVGADAALDAVKRGAPLVVVALDAGSVGRKVEVVEAAGVGRCIAWGTKALLGELMGDAERGVAICAVLHTGIAAELKKVRAAAVDASATATREEAGCRRPEAR
jgi:predicted RNA-binding protein YlxR (DUF448 family)/ribosomal protein L7Ae-like RNA K-turn-binding protein